MSESSMKRRDFAKLTFGALSGLAAGLTVDSQAEHHEKEKDILPVNLFYLRLSQHLRR